MKPFYTSFFTLTIIIFFSFLLSTSLQGQENRTINGFGNNINNPEWGAVGVNQRKVTPSGFADGMSEPGGQDRPNPRVISNTIFNQEFSRPDATELSDYAWVWGQFIDHDITASPEDPDQPFNIKVPTGDIYFDPAGTGTAEIHMVRSAYDPTSGTSLANPRAFPNAITAFIDGSAVYGSDINKAHWLRTFEGGKLKTSSGNLLPYNTISGEHEDEVDPNAPFMAMANPYHEKWFVAGDFRANENILLTSMHTIFVREHNRICDELIVTNPGWDDETIYQKTRKIIGGIIQAIVYEEWLPTLGVQIPEYSHYDASVNPGIMNVFSTAAYRYGHTVVNSSILRMNNSGESIPEGDVTLKEAFFNPHMFVEGGGVDVLLKGMATQVEQDFDTYLVHDLRNFLFGPPGSGGLDLASLNINRGRERGLPDYNTARMSFGLNPVESFEDLTSNPELNDLFKSVYSDINDIDCWVGFLAEDHMPNILFGETVMKIVGIQFEFLRDGDRFYYEIDEGLTNEEIEEIKKTRLADIINRNSGVEHMQDNVFLAQLHTSIPEVILEPLTLTIYPNPVSDHFFVNVTDVESGQANMQLSNLLGQVVLSKGIWLHQGITNFEVNLPPGIPNGIYSLTVAAGNQAGTVRILKQ